MRNRQLSSTLLIGVAVAGAAVAAGFAGYVFWDASSAVGESQVQVSAESLIPFITQPAAGSNSAGFEWIDAPSSHTNSALFAGRIYLAGPAGIVRLGLDGKPEAGYRAGLELPAAPAVSIASGVSTEGAGLSLYVATAGEGLLILSENSLDSEASDRDSTPAGQGAPGRKLGNYPNGPPFRQVRAEEGPYRDLTAVLPLSTGRVLLGSRTRGVLVYDGTTMSVLHPSLAGLHVTALAGDESSLWVGTLGGGVLYWHGGRLDRFGEPEGLPDPQVLTVAVSGSAAYVGTPLGVAAFRNGRFERVVAEGLFATALLAREQTLSVGTLDEGVFEVSVRTARPRARRLSRESSGQQLLNRVDKLFELNGRRYALADKALYVRHAKGAGWTRASTTDAPALSDANISALAADTSGKLWVGYFDRGLDILTPSGELLRHVEDEHVFCVNRIVHDPSRGLTAVATANGLVMFDSSGRIQQVLERRDGLIASHVTDVAIGPEGMTVATPSGLTFLDSGGIRSLYAFHGLVNNHVYTIAAAGQTLLAGTLGGLSILDAGVVRASYSTANSELKHNWITAVVPVGREWMIGTYGAGIVKLGAAGRLETFPEAGGGFEVNPNAMLASGTRIYAGTLDRGLYVYERPSKTWSSLIEGLPSRSVTALAVAGDYLYVGTNNGLVRIREQELKLR